MGKGFEETFLQRYIPSSILCGSHGTQLCGPQSPLQASRNFMIFPTVPSCLETSNLPGTPCKMVRPAEIKV